MRDDSTREVTQQVMPGPRVSGGLFKTSGLIALANLVSRLFGFAGDALKSYYFGAGGLVDAFNVAAAVPTLLNDLLIQSLVNSSYVPVFSSAKEQLWRLANALLNLTSLFFGMAVLLMEWAAPLLARLLNGGGSAEIQALTASLLHLTLPVLFVLNFSGMLSALLYARQRIVLPAVASIAFNGAILLAVLLLQAQLGITALAFGLLLGAVLQAAIQLFGLRGLARPYRLSFWHPGLRHIARLYGPILAGLLVEIFLSRPLTYAFASSTGEGGIAWMGYALTLRQAPEGLIAAALSVTVLVRLSAVPHEQMEHFRDILAEGLRLAFLLIIPCAVGLYLLAYPVTALFFEHGSFTAQDTAVVAGALRWYVWGLPFATVDLLLVMAFYARRNTLTPALIGVCVAFVYIGLSRLLLPVMGLYGLMLADSVKYMLHTGLSLCFLLRAVSGLRGVRRTLAQAMVASVVMGAAVFITAGLIVPGESIASRALAVLMPSLSGLLIYAAVLALSGADDLRLLRRLVLRRAAHSEDN